MVVKILAKKALTSGMAFKYKKHKYPFFAHISTGNRSYWYLVTDFPSVLMLIKEVLPIINDARRQEVHEIRTEEHEWKAKATEPHLYRKNCAHVS